MFYNDNQSCDLYYYYSHYNITMTMYMGPTPRCYDSNGVCTIAITRTITIARSVPPLNCYRNHKFTITRDTNGESASTITNRRT